MDKQIITLINREELLMDKVKTIDEFTDDFLQISCEDGIIDVEGEGLKIEEFINESGKIKVIGRIDGIFYKKSKQKKKR